jgi:amidohydrolase
LGTIRTSTESDRLLLHSQLKEAAESNASLYGCLANVQLVVGEPVLINDESLTPIVAKWVRESALLEESEPLRSCGADDFAYYGAAFPSVMTFVGMGTDFGPSLHNESFVPPDDSVSLVAKVLLAGYLAGCETALGPLTASDGS